MTKVSCIIPCYNSSYLSTLIRSIRNNSYKNIEIIIIDDFSDFEIKSVDCDLLVRNNDNYGPSYSRNIGAAQATGEIYLFLDSDIEIPKDLIAHTITFFSNNSNTIWTCGYSFFKNGLNVINRYKSSYMNFIHSEISRDVDFVLGACCAIKKENFIPWDEKMRFAEDTMWGNRLKYEKNLKIFFDKDISVNHYKDYKLLSWIRNDFSIARGMSKPFLKYKKFRKRLTFSHVSSSQSSAMIFVIFFLISVSCKTWLISIVVIIGWLKITQKKRSYISNQCEMSIFFSSILYFLNNIIHLFGIFIGHIEYFLKNIKSKLV